MESWGYKRLICCIFAVILFALGMCVEIDDVDSYFACEVQEQSDSYHKSDSHIFISSDYITNELLRPNNSLLIKNDYRNHVLRKSRGAIDTSMIRDAWSKLQASEQSLWWDYSYLTSSQVITIEYIHQQDGEK